MTGGVIVWSTQTNEQNDQLNKGKKMPSFKWIVLIVILASVVAVAINAKP